MALLSGLTLENFRSFRRRTTFDLAPLTIITGPNSSGKSSLLKALLFLRHNARLNRLHEPTFAGGDHNLGSLDNVRSHGSESACVSFGIGFDWGERESGEFEWYGDDGQRRDSFFDIGHIRFDLTYGDKADLLAYPFLTADSNLPRGNFTLDRFRIGTGRNGKRLLFELRTKGEVEEMLDVVYRDGSEESFSYPHLVYHYEVSLRGDWFFEDWDEAYDALGFPDPRIGVAEEAARLLSRPLRFRLKEPLPGTPLPLTKLVEAACDVAQWTNVEVDAEPISDPTTNSSLVRAVAFFVRPYLLRWTDYLTHNLGTVDHVGALRAAPRRLYGDEESDAFIQLIRAHTYPGQTEEDRRDHKRRVNEVNRMLLEFGIGDKLLVKRVADAAYTVQVERGGQRLHLVDLGYGYTQLLPLILHAAYDHGTDDRPFPTLLVEEPETNLHPNLQARLADLFVSLSRPEGSHTIIETHSEYLIRRLQYLVAKKEADPERIAIYYLGPDPEAEDYVRRIEIDRYGQLSQEFGPGFFDESTNLMVDLFKYGSAN